MASTGWGWIPSEEEMEIIWNMITQLGQEDINRLFYKNNLFHFVDNSRVKNAILNFLCKLDKPYMDPNVIPEEAKEELEVLCKEKEELFNERINFINNEENNMLYKTNKFNRIYRNIFVFFY